MKPFRAVSRDGGSRPEPADRQAASNRTLFATRLGMNERDIERLWVQVGRLTRMQRKEVIGSLTRRQQPANPSSCRVRPTVDIGKYLGPEHHPVVTSKGARAIGAWIQIVNSYHGRFEGWMHRFQGLATFYLENCLGWFRALDRTPRSASQPAQLLNLAIGA